MKLKRTKNVFYIDNLYPFISISREFIAIASRKYSYTTFKFYLDEERTEIWL